MDKKEYDLFLKQNLAIANRNGQAKNAVIADISISKTEYAEHVANEINKQIQELINEASPDIETLIPNIIKKAILSALEVGENVYARKNNKS